MIPLEKEILRILARENKELAFSEIASFLGKACPGIFLLDDILTNLVGRNKLKVRSSTYSRHYTLIRSNEVTIHEED